MEKFRYFVKSIKQLKLYLFLLVINTTCNEAFILITLQYSTVYWILLKVMRICPSTTTSVQVSTVLFVAFQALYWLL